MVCFEPWALEVAGSNPADPTKLRTKLTSNTILSNLHTCKIHVSEDEYSNYLKNIDRPLRDNTIRSYWYMIQNYLQQYDTLSQDNVTEYLRKITNQNTYNNSAKALIHLGRMNHMRIAIRFRRSSSDNLIIAPSYDKVRTLIHGIQDSLVKAYLSLCATTGIRVQRILSLTWNDIDLENGFVLRKIEDIRTKHYRPNPLHSDARILLEALPQDTDRIFPLLDGKRIRSCIAQTKQNITPTQLRDFFYNQALTCAMNPVIVEWLMGHDIGIAKHYIADNIKREYARFEAVTKFH